MFSQLHFVRLKAAEAALKEGRYDDVLRMVTAADLQGNQRATAIRQQLADVLLERARAHYHADRYREALSDLNLATVTGFRVDEVKELRHYVETVAAEQQRNDHARRDQLDNARRRVERGSLAAGEKLLKGAPRDDSQANRLKDEVKQRSEDVSALVKQIKESIKTSQFAAAALKLKQARGIDRSNSDLVRLEADLCSKVVDTTRKSLIEGRLSRAADELACLDTLGDDLPSKREMVDLLSIAGQAGAALREQRFGEAKSKAMALARLLPKANWLGNTIAQLEHAEEVLAALHAGPLGEPANLLMTFLPGGAPSTGRHGQPRLAETQALPAAGRQKRRTTDDPGAAGQGFSGQQSLLLVDGGGSYLIIRGDNVSLGRAAAARPAMVPIFSDLAEQHATIQRNEDDYFLSSTKPFEVGGRKLTYHLLRDGDRVMLGRKAKFTFRVPSRRSSTAVLDLSDTTKMPNDVRRVVLFRRHATLGSGRSAHISCRHANPPLVLFERDGRLHVRPKNDGHVAPDAMPLSMGQPVEISGVGLALNEWVLRSKGTLA